MSEFAFYMDVLRALEAMGAAYVTTRAGRIGTEALTLRQGLAERIQRHAPGETLRF